MIILSTSPNLDVKGTKDIKEVLRVDSHRFTWFTWGGGGARAASSPTKNNIFSYA